MKNILHFFAKIVSILAFSTIIFFVVSCGKKREPGEIKNDTPSENVLQGSWTRTDGSYMIRINSVKDDGTVEAGYFNPREINVSRGEWTKEAGTLKLFIELRDRNYPGSKYLLSYLPGSDKLAGDYYQAVQGITFYVEFERTGQ